MKKWLKEFDRLSDGILEGFQNLPLVLRSNKRLLNKLIMSALMLVSILTIIIWILSACVNAMTRIWIQNKDLIIITFVALGIVYSSIMTQIEKRQAKKKQCRLETLELQNKKAFTQYTYLRLFLYKILDEKLCSLIEIAKPITPNILNAVIPLTIDDQHGIIYYNFQVHKLKTIPFSQGTDYVQNLLASHVIAKSQIDGVAGISAPIGDSLITPVYVDAVNDLGSTATIVLALDCEGYRTLKELKKHARQTGDLIEHI